MMTWQPYELHTALDLKSFLIHTLAPRWATLQARFEGRAFYVVWWPDSCIRLRVGSSSLGAHAAPPDLGLGLEWIVGSYERELARYGGAVGLDLAERFFCRSSRLALALLQLEPRQSEHSIGRALAAASVLSASLARAFGQSARQWREQWLTDLVRPRRWERAAQELANRRSPQALPTQADLRRSLWAIGTELDDLGTTFGRRFAADVTNAASLSTSLLHGFMNRLAVQPLDELYIAWLLLEGKVASLDDTMGAGPW